MAPHRGAVKSSSAHIAVDQKCTCPCFSELIGCISHFSVAIKYHDQKQVVEGRVYFSLQFQRGPVLHDGKAWQPLEGMTIRTGS